MAQFSIFGGVGMEIYIFDKALNMKGILGSYSSLIWRRKYSKHGDFELHCALNSINLELLKKGNVIWKNDDDEEAGYIEYRNLKQDATGKEVLVLKGKFLTGYLDRRIIWNRLNLNTASELAIRELINSNVINPMDTTRKIDLMALGELKNYSQSLNKQVSYKNLLETIEEIANVSELGFKTILDIQNKQMVFDVYEGLDRTANNGVNAPAIFSKEFENILEQEYTDSLNDYRNTVLVAGEGEGSDRELVSIENGQGLDRYELFVDARDLQSTKTVNEEEVPIPIQEYRQMLEDRGISKLSEHKEIKTFDSKVNLNSNLEYGIDFNLGDLVTCTSKKWGVTINTRITEIEEVYEESGKQVNITFGNNIPSLIDVIKREVIL